MIKKILISTYKYYYIVWQEKSFAIFFRIIKSYKKNGLLEVHKQLQSEYLQHNMTYQKWIKKNENNILTTEKLHYTPLISIVTPTFNTNIVYLKEMIQSVVQQTYHNWELCIADDASTDPKIKKVLQKYSQKNSNIKLSFRDENGHISEASNSALDLATGEYVAFLDHDDTLAPNALYEMVRKLNEHRELKLIYSDEDKIDQNNIRHSPHFKSGWNKDMFLSQNYICHFTMIKKDVVDCIGGFRKGYEGSQDYDLLLRSLNYVKEDEIDRVEKVLYHWRAVEGSTAYSSGEKDYAHEAGRKALQDFLDSQKINARAEDGLLPNTYKVNYNIKNMPLVSLLIPTRDGYDVLHKCIESILEKTEYGPAALPLLKMEYPFVKNFIQGGKPILPF